VRTSNSARNCGTSVNRGVWYFGEAAEAIAPTHPHPGVETSTKNVLVGPFAAVADRTKDVVRKAMGRGDV
jgi:hypothetical protein